MHGFVYMQIKNLDTGEVDILRVGPEGEEAGDGEGTDASPSIWTARAELPPGLPYTAKLTSYGTARDAHGSIFTCYKVGVEFSGAPPRASASPAKRTPSPLDPASRSPPLPPAAFPSDLSSEFSADDSSHAGPLLSSWSVFRRYSDFYALQGALRKEGFAPRAPFPSKRTFGRFQNEFIVARKAMLQAWIDDVLRSEEPDAFESKTLGDFFSDDANTPPPGFAEYTPPTGSDAVFAAEAARSARERKDSVEGVVGAAAGAGAGGPGSPPSPPTRSKINLSDFQLLKVIGKGSFGTVLLVSKNDTGKIYAMKILEKKAVIKRKQVEHTKTERRVLEYTKHPFVVGLHFAFQTKSKLYLVMDYCAGGELFFHLGRLGRFRESMACFYTAELVLALGHLHAKGIVYRDMKPENVLLDANGHVKLADFGLSKEGITDSVAGTKSFCGTPEYLAPEILDRKGHGTAVDWWSLGMLLFEMLTGLPPWYTKDRKQLYESLRFARIEFPAYVSPPARSVIKGFLTRDPSRRLGSVRDAEEVMEHPFFASIDWRAMRHQLVRPPFAPTVRGDACDTRNFDDHFTNMPITASIQASTRNSRSESFMSTGSPFNDFTYEDPSELARASRASFSRQA